MLCCVHVVVLFTALSQLEISPPAATVDHLESVSFTASGGAEPYRFELVADVSMGSITVDGVYTAGPFDAPDGGDRVRATDRLAVTAFVDVTVLTPYAPPPPPTGCGATGDQLAPLLGLFLVPALLTRRTSLPLGEGHERRADRERTGRQVFGECGDDPSILRGAKIRRECARRLCFCLAAQACAAAILVEEDAHQ
jgi:hypothetical protein